MEELGVPFAGESLKRYGANLRRAPAIKDWRTTEFEAGRPSSLGDYYRAHSPAQLKHACGFVKMVQVQIAWSFAAEVSTYQKRESVIESIRVDYSFGVRIAVFTLADEDVTKVGPHIERVVT